MRLDISTNGDLEAIMEGEYRAAERAVTLGIRAGTAELQNAWRNQVRSSGLGSRLANAIRKKDYPAGTNSISAAGLVYGRRHSKSSPMLAEDRDADAATLLYAFDHGVTITARRKRFLAIPLPSAGTHGFIAPRARGASGGVYESSRTRKRKISPARWEKITGRKLRFVPRKGKPPLLVIDNAKTGKRGTVTRRNLAGSADKTRKGDQTVPVFILLPVVRLRKRLDLDSDTRRVEAQLPEMILSRWKG